MKAPPAKAWMPANGRLEVSAEVNTDVEVERAWRHGVTVVTPRNGHQLCRPPPAPAKRPRTHVWEDIFRFSHHPFPTLSQFQCIYHTHCYLSHSKFNNVEIWEEMWSAKSQWLCHKKFTHVMNKFYLKVTHPSEGSVSHLEDCCRLSYQGWRGSRRNYPSGGRVRDLQWQLWVIKHFLNVFWCSWSLSLVINYGVVSCRFEISNIIVAFSSFAIEVFDKLNPYWQNKKEGVVDSWYISYGIFLICLMPWDSNPSSSFSILIPSVQF